MNRDNPELDLSFDIVSEIEWLIRVQISPDSPDFVEISYREHGDTKRNAHITMSIAEAKLVQKAIGNLIEFIEKQNEKQELGTGV